MDNEDRVKELEDKIKGLEHDITFLYKGLIETAQSDLETAKILRKNFIVDRNTFVLLGKLYKILVLKGVLEEELFKDVLEIWDETL